MLIQKPRDPFLGDIQLSETTPEKVQINIFISDFSR